MDRSVWSLFRWLWLIVVPALSSVTAIKLP